MATKRHDAILNASIPVSPCENLPLSFASKTTSNCGQRKNPESLLGKEKVLYCTECYSRNKDKVCCCIEVEAL